MDALTATNQLIGEAIVTNKLLGATTPAPINLMAVKCIIAIYLFVGAATIVK